MTKQEFLAMSLSYDLKAFNENLFGREILSIKGLSFGDVIHQYGISPAHYVTPILYPLLDYQKIKHLIDVTDKIGIISVIDGDFDFTKLRFDLILKLVQNHFDFLGLIEKGEAIDVNTLEVNPYK